ncbi:M23 family metallopeptidase [Dietzia aurantiaca]|uniref:M23 family metallopeptidase n=1 Tax=Dietzia aurantiaca TaxID=983873 RepID=UPI001E41C0B3|nr:M23 family metallopeptidase [Dietzia aurantiaca]MCD2264341.1 M23 family metallopeptidase [Dietzia aurantiaca]
MPAPPTALRGRAAVLAVAAGAAVSAASAGSAMTTTNTHATEAGDIALLANGEQAPATSSSSAPSSAATPTPSAPAPVVVPASASTGGTDNIQSAMLFAGTEINAQREIDEEMARRPKVVLPTVGTFTSPFAMRWGTHHGGIDIANSPGTSIVAATDGVVIESGPAQGYGNWIRIKADDGTITTYGHMQTLDVAKGERVMAGQKIAGMGSLGFSTGSHLHFEVEIDGQKVDPVPWLLQHGLDVMGGASSEMSLGSLGGN